MSRKITDVNVPTPKRVVTVPIRFDLETGKFFAEWKGAMVEDVSFHAVKDALPDLVNGPRTETHVLLITQWGVPEHYLVTDQKFTIRDSKGRTHQTRIWHACDEEGKPTPYKRWGLASNLLGGFVVPWNPETAKLLKEWHDALDDLEQEKRCYEATVQDVKEQLRAHVPKETSA